jgi:hypothetical protein
LLRPFKNARDPSLGRPINEQLAVLLVANPATEKKDRERRERAFNPIAVLVETVNLANLPLSVFLLHGTTTSLEVPTPQHPSPKDLGL